MPMLRVVIGLVWYILSAPFNTRGWEQLEEMRHDLEERE